MQKTRARCFDAPLAGDALREHTRAWAEYTVEGWTYPPGAEDALRDLREAVREIQRASLRGEELLPASAWLMDNFPMLEEAALCARTETASMGKLPAIRAGGHPRLPRAYAIAREAVAHSDARVDGDVLAAAAEGYLKARRMMMGELWVLPRMARVALLGAAAETARGCALSQRERTLADRLFARVSAHDAPDLSEVDQHASGTFVERLLWRVREEGSAVLGRALDERLKSLDVRPEAVAAHEHARQADAQLRMSNAVVSLRALDALDWAPIFERLCPVEHALREERSGIYARMDFASREAVRRAVERVAQSLNAPETHVARVAVRLADEGEGRAAHVGWYLMGGGTSALHEALTGHTAKGTTRERAGAWYMAGIALVTASASVAVGLWLGWWQALLLALPLFGLAEQWGGYIVGRAVKPRVLLKYDFEGGIPPEASTLIVIPALIGDVKRVQAQLDVLENHWITNGGENVRCMLLADFGDHAAPEKEGDEAIVAALREGIARLNDRHGSAFAYLHRPRVLSKTQGRYMGWERKRGALAQLNEALIAGDFSAFSVVEGDVRRPVYVLTLDADTVLPVGATHTLAGALAHPMNRRGADGRGYALIAPRIGSLLGAKTAFARLFSSGSGVDMYASHVSNVYQDLFGQGSFQGKGIYDLEAFHGALEGRFEENTILSHDLIEGIYASAALCSEVEVYDGAPAHLPGWMNRQHRWIRGDWQLLPILIKDKTLTVFDRWRIAGNMIRSLQPVALALCLILGAWLSPGVVWMAVTVYFAPLLLQLKTLVYGDVRPFTLALARFAFLPYEAWMSADAVLRTLVRLKTRKNLLSWVTAADAERSTDPARGNGGRMWMCMAAALLMSANIHYAPIIALFAAAPWIARTLARPVASHRPSAEDRTYLEDVARRVYRWFETYDTHFDRFLPPDNVQYDPAGGVAHRTSPTNMGFKLAADIAARDLGFIDEREMLARLERTLSSIQALEKWHGHAYNWYDTRTLEPLTPRYVSSVDSGNLAACLMALSQTLREMDTPDAARLMAASDALIADMDFTLLYSRTRRLFHIGYDADNNRLSDAYYDLLASEARLTSMAAIALGQVPAEHFASMGRPMTAIDGRKGLLSWGGSIFEYIMPQLFLPSFDGSLADEGCAAAVHAQRLAAGDNPWGESESGYYAFDLSLNYQYKSFGVPALMLKGGVPEERVIAPYATALSLLYAPREALDNLKRLEGLGMLCEYGFYEALDYTPKRLGGEPFRAVRSLMAHHQGMTLLALEAVLSGRMRARFARIPGIRAHATLLNERMPTGYIKPRQRPERAENRVFREQHFARAAGRVPDCALLSGGGSTLMLDERMRGWARWRGLSLSRHDAYNPSPVLGLLIDGKPFVPEKALFDADRAVYSGACGGVCAEVSAAVSPEDGALVCTVRATPRAAGVKVVSVTAFTEPALSPPEADRAHRAFQNLFIATAACGGDGVRALKRPRGEEARAGLMLIASGEGKTTGRGTDRFAFLGRGYKPYTQSMEPSTEHMLSVTRTAAFAHDMPVEVSFSLIPYGEGEDADALRERYADAASLRRAFDLTHTRAHVEAAYLGMSAGLVKAACRLAASMLTPGAAASGTPYAERSTLPQSGLFRFGLSGEMPMIAARVGELEHLRMVGELLRIHGYWRSKGLFADLVIINDYGNDYLQPVRDRLTEMIEGSHARHLSGARGGVFPISGVELDLDERALIMSRAGVTLDGADGALDKQIAGMAHDPHMPPEKSFSGAYRDDVPLEPVRSMGLIAFNGLGGFLEDGSYVIDLPPGAQTPAPWSNVLADGRIGAVVTERGGGYIFSENSRERKITPWSNDPVMDGHGFDLYVRDEATGAVFTPARGTLGGASHTRATHGQGFTSFETGAQGLHTRLSMYVDAHSALRHTLTVENPSPSARHLSVIPYMEAVLGADRDLSAPSVVTGYHAQSGLLWARNAFGFPGVVYMAAPGCDVIDFTCSRREFMGDAVGGRPDAMDRAGLSRTAGGGLDPCMAIRLRVSVPAGGSVTLEYAIGCAPGVQEAIAAISTNDPNDSLEAARARWDTLLGRVEVTTGDAAADKLVNRWLPYQVWASRYLARTAFYQAGGAYGFRDQLQDALLFVYYKPEELRAHLLRAAAHQFEEGDVQHWWHEPASGVRTRMSDDLLFLPYCAAEYARKTGDYDVFDEMIPWLRGASVPEGEQDLYFQPESTAHRDTLYEHCLRAIRRAMDFGVHGLPKMGGGDWNDAMNRVGEDGRGESVWLAFFLYAVLDGFTAVCKGRGDDEHVEAFAREQGRLRDAIEEHGWDGAWYRRAYFDDGTPMGAKGNAECEIDCVAQSWAALSGAADPARAKTAMDSALERLFDREYNVLRLLDPPFEGKGSDPGYIRSYMPGVRENGGQYTHAAAWAVLALAALGDRERAYELLTSILPTGHASDRNGITRYKVEPYAAAADVYAGLMPGRGGWTWYTGSAAWLWRAMVEGVLGLRMEGGIFSLERRGAPKGLKGYTVRVDGAVVEDGDV